jgi:hypothetical protein
MHDHKRKSYLSHIGSLPKYFTIIKTIIWMKAKQNFDDHYSTAFEGSMFRQKKVWLWVRKG